MLTEKEKRAIDQLTALQTWRLVWWSLFNQKKIAKWREGVRIGKHGRAAFIDALLQKKRTRLSKMINNGTPSKD